jgi:hypothetical protein
MVFGKQIERTWCRIYKIRYVLFIEPSISNLEFHQGCLNYAMVFGKQKYLAWGRRRANETSPMSEGLQSEGIYDAPHRGPHSD